MGFQRRPRRALPPYTPPAAPVAVRTSPDAHVVTQSGLSCGRCVERAYTWTRCGTCRALIATCGDHPTTLAQDAAAHRAAHQGATRP